MAESASASAASGLKKVYSVSNNNGGPTKTIALQANSPAIDRITPITSCTDQSSNPITTDQRLFARPDFGNLNTCDSGAYEFGALPPVVLNSHTVQIARSTTPNTDKVNLALNFTQNPDGDNDCDPDDDLLRSGVDVELFAGSCANISTTGLDIFLSPFVVHTIGTSSYGTFFNSTPPKTVSAKIVTQATPPGACGRWTLNVAVAGINSTPLGSGPFALIISDLATDGAGCFNITDALVGNQITKPAHGVRRSRR